MKTETRHVKDSLAYVGITGWRRNLHITTCLKLHDYTKFTQNLDRLYELTAEGQALAEQSSVWRAHQWLVANGFVFSTDRLKATPSFIPYRHTGDSVTKTGRIFSRTAWISKGGRVYADLPDETTASGWRTGLVERDGNGGA